MKDTFKLALCGLLFIGSVETLRTGDSLNMSIHAGVVVVLLIIHALFEYANH